MIRDKDVMKPGPVRKRITDELEGFKGDLTQRTSNKIEIIITVVVVIAIVGGVAALLVGMLKQ